MRSVGKVKRKEGSDYLVNKLGEVIEVTQTVEVVAKIDAKKGHEYFVDTEGNIIELKVMDITQEEYENLKNSGRLPELLKRGVKLNIVPSEEATLSQLEEIEKQNIEASLVGATIEKASIERKKDGSREFVLCLSNGKKLTLREGLLVKGSSIEIE